MTPDEIKALIDAAVRESGQLAWDKVLSDGFAFVRCADLLGTTWEVRVLRFGTSANGWGWAKESGEKLLPFLKNAPVGVYAYKGGMAHAKEEDVHAASGAVTRNIVGDLQEPRIEADGVYAKLHLHEDAGWLKTKLLGLQQRGVVDKVLGLSVDTLAGYVQEGAARVIKEVKRLFSVDIVSAPSADGRFLRATEGLNIPDPKETEMKTSDLVAIIKEHRPALLEGKDPEKLTADELSAMVKEALTPPKVTPPPEPPKLPDATAAALKRIEEFEKTSAVRETQARVTEALADSKLPDIIKARVKKDFTGKVATEDEVKARVKEEIDTLAALDPSGNVTGFGGTTRVELGADAREKLQAGLDQLFGVTPKAFERAMESSPFLNQATSVRIMESVKSSFEAAKVVPAFRGLRDAYVQITGDTEVSGIVKSKRITEAQFSADWTNILGNTLYRRMIMDYAEPQYNERTIARYGSAVDFRTKEVTLLEYFPDIATVDPEVADYAEIAKLGDAKVSYAVIQKGNILTITRKTIINDDLGTVQKLVGRLGRSARRTLARFIWNFWITNATYDADSTAWFHVDHGNTGATALTADATGAAEVLAKIIQLADMTEPGSGEKLGLPPMESLYLDVPHALYAVALRLNQAPEFGAGTANMVYQRFGPNGERINVNSLFSDATDWGVHMSPGAAGRESIQIDFLQGREEPELFLADNPTVGQMFYADKLQYKLRAEWGGDIIDFRGATKNVVAG